MGRGVTARRHVVPVHRFAEGTRVRKRPFPVDQLVAVLDLNGLSTSQISSTVINYVRAVSGIDQLRYPGAWAHVITLGCT